MSEELLTAGKVQAPPADEKAPLKIIMEPDGEPVEWDPGTHQPWWEEWGYREWCFEGLYISYQEKKLNTPEWKCGATLFIESRSGNTPQEVYDAFRAVLQEYQPLHAMGLLRK